MSISTAERFSIYMRNIIFPFTEAEKLAPKKGRILDVGCGHGTFCLLLAKGSPRRMVVGVDPAYQKIAIARLRGKHISNLTFLCGYVDKLRGEKFDVVTVIDILYLLPMEEKLRLLKTIHSLLGRNGIFILKETSANLSVQFAEFVMIRLLKRTHSRYKKTHFLPCQSYESMLLQGGFEIKGRKTIRTLGIYEHIFFVCKSREIHTTGEKHSTLITRSNGRREKSYIVSSTDPLHLS